MSPNSTPGQRSPVCSTTTGKSVIGAITITLNGPSKIDGNEALQTTRGPGRVPLVDHIASRSMRDPKIPLSGFSISRIKIFNRCFIHLNVRPTHQLKFHFHVNVLQPFTHHAPPAPVVLR